MVAKIKTKINKKKKNNKKRLFVMYFERNNTIYIGTLFKKKVLKENYLEKKI